MARRPQPPPTASVDENRLTPDDAGLEYARTLSDEDRGAYLANVANELRARDHYQQTRAGHMVLLLQTCESLEDARSVLDAAEAALLPIRGVSATTGEVERGVDRTWIQYRSNLLRGFRLGVLPADSFLTEREIRRACLDKSAANRMAEAVRTVDEVGPEAEDEADDIEEEFSTWIHTIPPALRLQLWDEVTRIRKKYEDMARQIATARRPARTRTSTRARPKERAAA